MLFHLTLVESNECIFVLPLSGALCSIVFWDVLEEQSRAKIGKNLLDLHLVLTRFDYFFCSSHVYIDLK
jgi:hypothetical protein